MAKVKAMKAAKATLGDSKTGTENPKASKPKEAPKTAVVAHKGKPKPEEPQASAPPEPSSEAMEAPAAPPAALGVKKKNVKRGAPPMLPRRMARRPEPPVVPGQEPAVPAQPRLIAQPGSLHAPARVPEGAESLKQRLGRVMTLLNQLRGLKRTLNRNFFEAGRVLQQLAEPALYQAKGYGSFEKFVEREIERELSIGRSLAHDLVQIVRVFQQETTEELGLERLRNALRALWPELGSQNNASTNSSGSNSPSGSGSSG